MPLNDETLNAKEANSKKKDSLKDGSSESFDGDFVCVISRASGGGGSGPDCGSLCTALQKSVSCTSAHGKSSLPFYNSYNTVLPICFVAVLFITFSNGI